MKKVKTLFRRNPDNRSLVIDKVEPECQWVLDGEGVATQKIDGTCCMIRHVEDFGLVLYKRRTVKPGKLPPVGFELCDEDRVTGKSFGWVPVDGSNVNDGYHMEAFGAFAAGLGDDRAWLAGTYELVGPKIQGNPEGYDEHRLIWHGSLDYPPGRVPRTFDGLRVWLEGAGVEGIVWHHPDGRMAKIKGRDFGHVRDAS